MSSRYVGLNQMESLSIDLYFCKCILCHLLWYQSDFISNFSELLPKRCSLLLLFYPSLNAFLVSLLPMTLCLLLESFWSKHTPVLVHIRWQSISRSSTLSSDRWVRWCRVRSCTRWYSSTRPRPASLTRLRCPVASLLCYLIWLLFFLLL